MPRIKDMLTLDLFDVPVAAPSTPGAMNYAREIAAVMSQALKECPFDRVEVAARMTRLLGREISLSMLNAYTAESREMHNISLERAIAFDAATESFALLNFYSAKRGCKVMVGKDSLLAELGRIDQMKADLARQEKAIKNYLERGKA